MIEPFAQRRLAGGDDHFLDRQLFADDQLVDQGGGGDVDVEEAAEGGQVVLERGEVVNDVAALERGEQGFFVANVADDELDARVEIIGALAVGMDGRFEAVERANVVAACEQGVGGVRSDESGSAGDQGAHGWLTSSWMRALSDWATTWPTDIWRSSMRP